MNLSVKQTLAHILPLPLGTGISGAVSPTLWGSGGFGEPACAASPARPAPSPPSATAVAEVDDRPAKFSQETKPQSRKFKNNLPTCDTSKGYEQSVEMLSGRDCGSQTSSLGAKVVTVYRPTNHA